jgi:hypothetical protein
MESKILEYCLAMLLTHGVREPDLTRSLQMLQTEPHRSPLHPVMIGLFPRSHFFARPQLLTRT